MHITLSFSGISEHTRVEPYESEAPQTCKAILNALPVEGVFKQARFAGEEIWCDDALELFIPQENATIHPKPGEIGYAPPLERSEVANSIAIVYGEATLSDAVNIFGRVVEEDLPKLKALGEKVWLEGKQIVRLEHAET